MSISLAEIQESIKSEIKVNSDGKGFITIRGAARLADVSDSTLIRAFSKAVDVEAALNAVLFPRQELDKNEGNLKVNHFLIHYGFDAAAQKAFSTEMIPDLALALILNYYAMYAGKYRTVKAQMAVLAFSATGIRTWIQQASGYVEPVKVLEPREDGLEFYSHLKPVKPFKSEDKLFDTNRIKSKEIEDHSIFKRLLAYCNGQPVNSSSLGSGHAFVRRQDVLRAFGKKKHRWLNKPELLILLKSAEAAGYGVLKMTRKQIYVFTPSNCVPRLTA